MTKFKVVLTLFITLILAAGLFGTPAARSYQAATESKPTRWEYISESVDANSVQSKLNEWASQQWEFVAMVETDRSVETTDKPRIIVDKFQVTARRPVKQ
ncbi:MAG: hypothetical protein NT013_08145 [Planctomycetia bacterium]|nr:hypothetical protein [Planctomycetia bacterium]